MLSMPSHSIKSTSEIRKIRSGGICIVLSNEENQTDLKESNCVPQTPVKRGWRCGIAA